MNNQYPASPTPGQPDPNQSDPWQSSQWQNYLARQGQGYGQNPDQPDGSAYSAGQFSPGGDAFGAGSSGVFGGGAGAGGPFSSGGTTSFFGSGSSKETSAWGTPVPGGRPAYGGGAQVPPIPGAPYRNYNTRNSRRRSPLGMALGALLVVVMLGLGAFFAIREGDQPDAAPAPSPTASQFTNPAPAPTADVTTEPSTTSTDSTGPVNGQNADGSVTVGTWKVEKLEFLPDASEKLANIEEPVAMEPGHHMAGIKMRFTNNGAQALSPAYSVGVTVYFDNGDRAWEEMSINEAESVQSLEAINPGESVEGWFYAQVPDGYAGGDLGFFDYDNSRNVESDLTLP